MSDYIDRQAALDAIQAEREYMTRREEWLAEHILTHCGYRIIEDMPAADVAPVVRCKDCVHQTKFWHNDGRMKNGGYYICGCDLVDGYSHVCLDDDFCSRGERMDGDDNAE